jgi:hypothetical protein
VIDPTVRLQASFLAAVSEFREDHGYPTPWFVNDVDPPALTDTAAFATYVTRVLGERDEVAGRANWFVPMTTLWWAEGDLAAWCTNACPPSRGTARPSRPGAVSPHVIVEMEEARCIEAACTPF